MKNLIKVIVITILSLTITSCANEKFELDNEYHGEVIFIKSFEYDFLNNVTNSVKGLIVMDDEVILIPSSKITNDIKLLEGVQITSGIVTFKKVIHHDNYGNTKITFKFDDIKTSEFEFVEVEDSYSYSSLVNLAEYYGYYGLSDDEIDEFKGLLELADSDYGDEDDYLEMVEDFGLGYE